MPLFGVDNPWYAASVVDKKMNLGSYLSEHVCTSNPMPYIDNLINYIFHLLDA